MPATSKAQRRLMGAALHGADFPMAKAVRQSMTSSQMRDFATTPEKKLPAHVKPAPSSYRARLEAVKARGQ